MKQPPGGRPVFHLYATQPEHQLPEPSGIEEGLLSRGDSKTVKAAKQRGNSRAIKLGTFMTLTFALAYVVAGLVFRQDKGLEWAVLPQQNLLNLERLREYGERLGRRFPGAAKMGMGGQSKSAFLPVDWDKVRQSCAPNPLVAARDGSDRKQPKVVLVTGSAGFVGMHTAMQLRKRGDGVLGIDNFNDYYPVSLKRARQLHAEAGGVYTVDGDINDVELLRALFEVCQFTHVVHMAAQAGVRYATRNPFSYVHANLGGQVALFEVAKDQPQPPAIVYASSSSVYGLNKKQPFSEDDRVDNPASLYAATKRADELMAHVYHNIYGLSMTGLRFFTVYGPWGRPDMAAYKFAVSMMKGDAIPIFQGPNRSELSRDFTFIDDIVKGVVSSVDTSSPSVKGEAEYRIFNLGNTNPHTVTELVTLLESYLGRTAKKKYLPVPPTGDVLATYADISRAKRDLGYKPEVSLEEGLRRFSGWFRDFYGSALDAGAKMPDDWNYKPL